MSGRKDQDDMGKEQKAAPAWEGLKKAWSLTDCQRQVAIAIACDRAREKLHGLREKAKATRKRLEADSLTDAEEKKLAQRLWRLRMEIGEATATIKNATEDLLRIPIESIGGTLFQAGGSTDDADDDQTGDLYQGEVDKDTGEVLTGADDGKDAPSTQWSDKLLISVGVLPFVGKWADTLRAHEMPTLNEVRSFLRDNGGDYSKLPVPLAIANKLVEEIETRTGEPIVATATADSAA